MGQFKTCSKSCVVTEVKKLSAKHENVNKVYQVWTAVDGPLCTYFCSNEVVHFAFKSLPISCSKLNCSCFVDSLVGVGKCL